jgi:predicted dinucleotide-binding enzyme
VRGHHRIPVIRHTGYRKVIGEQESSGQILAGLLPAGARLVKAFGTLSAPSLSAAARQEPERAVPAVVSVSQAVTRSR